MIAKAVDYQWHYDEFVRRHSSDPSLRMARYCDESGIRRQRMYEWMTRRGLSLKRIYADAGRSAVVSKTTGATAIPSTGFPPLIVTPPLSVAEDDSNLVKVRISLPNGVGIEIEKCSVNDLMALTGGPLCGCHV